MGNPGKTQFPADWRDEKIAAIIVDVARQPDRARWQRHGRWRVEGTRGGATVIVIVEASGAIRTAFPAPDPGTRS
ncbi:MAG: EndoU domain-containing protein [Nocardioidaceae bacterium]